MQGSWQSQVKNHLSTNRIQCSLQTPEVGSLGEFAPSKDYSYAFQAIINVASSRIFSFEALIRTKDNQPAEKVLNEIPQEGFYQFDMESREHAIKLAAHLGLECNLNLNVLPLSLCRTPDCIDSVVETTRASGLKTSQIVLELLEDELMSDAERLFERAQHYRKTGITFAIDDFGAGFAGLRLLADFQPDYIKLDRHLIKSIHRDSVRQAIVEGVCHTCRNLVIQIVAEGVESVDEYLWLRDREIFLFQGWLFAKPHFESLCADFFIPSS
ncbi:MAG: EAL domain-containing protein [Opitutae bacterium]